MLEKAFISVRNVCASAGEQSSSSVQFSVTGVCDWACVAASIGFWQATKKAVRAECVQTRTFLMDMSECKIGPFHSLCAALGEGLSYLA